MTDLNISIICIIHLGITNYWVNFCINLRKLIFITFFITILINMDNWILYIKEFYQITNLSWVRNLASSILEHCTNTTLSHLNRSASEHHPEYQKTLPTCINIYLGLFESCLKLAYDTQAHAYMSPTKFWHDVFEHTATHKIPRPWPPIFAIPRRSRFPRAPIPLSPRYIYLYIYIYIC